MADDQYATSRANLRDTIKWLAGTFSALAAVVVAGVPVSGIGKLDFPSFQLLWASIALVVAFGSICGALAITVSLLRGDIFYLSELESALDADEKANAAAETAEAARAAAIAATTAAAGPGGKAGAAAVAADTAAAAADAAADAAKSAAACAEAKAAKQGPEIGELVINLNDYAIDLLPNNYDTPASLMAEAARLRNQEKSTQKAALAVPPDQAALAAYSAAVARSSAFQPTLQKLTNYSSYFVFYSRLRQSLLPLFGLGTLALLSLVAFGMLVHVPDKPPQPSTIVNNLGRDFPASADTANTTARTALPIGPASK